jgi:hypothetical protein
MDTSTLQSFLPHLTSITPAAIAVALFWIMWRAKSMYPFWLRLWTLFHRKEPADADWLATAMDERRALLKFRVLFGWVDTLPQALRLDAWAKKHRVDAGSICDCGDFFDRQALQLKELPSKTGAMVRIVPAYLAVCILFGFGLMAVTTTDGVFGLKSTGRLLAIDGTSVRAFGQGRWTALTRTDCAGSEDPGHLGVDRGAACEILQYDRLARRVTDTVAAQREVGGVAFLYAFLIGVPALRYATSLRAAGALRREEAQDDEDGDDAAGDADDTAPRMALVG